jgi:hypothetical protein
MARELLGVPEVIEQLPQITAHKLIIGIGAFDLRCDRPGDFPRSNRDPPRVRPAKTQLMSRLLAVNGCLYGRD